MTITGTDGADVPEYDTPKRGEMENFMNTVEIRRAGFAQIDFVSGAENVSGEGLFALVNKANASTFPESVETAVRNGDYATLALGGKVDKRGKFVEVTVSIPDGVGNIAKQAKMLYLGFRCIDGKGRRWEGVIKNASLSKSSLANGFYDIEFCNGDIVKRKAEWEDRQRKLRANTFGKPLACTKKKH